MLQITLHSLACVVMLSAMVLTGSILAIWRIYPHERGLRHWALGGALFSAGFLEIALRNLFMVSLLIPVGNALLAMGMGFLLIGVRRVLNLRVPPLLALSPWLAGLGIFLSGCYYIAISHSDILRIEILSLLTAAFHLQYAWAFFRQREQHLQGWFRLTVGIQLLGAGLYVIRALLVPAPMQPTFTAGSASSMPMFLSAFFTLFFNVWMTTTAALVASARASRAYREAGDFNRAILGHTPIAMGVYDATGRCVQVNAAYTALFDVESQQVLARNFYQIAAWQTAGVVEKCKAALAETREQQIEAQVLTQQNKELWVDCRILPARIHGQQHLLIMFIDLTQRKRLEMTLQEMAFHDALTQLPNRRLLLDRINRALLGSQRSGQYGAILYIDLDRFKPFNDLYGHGLGDKLLVQMAQRLQAAVRASDTVARLGGDEFVVMLEGLGLQVETAEAQAQGIARAIDQRLREPYVLDGLIYRGTASIGVHLFGAAREDSDELLQQADAAMYAAKRQRQATQRAGHATPP